MHDNNFMDVEVLDPTKRQQGLLCETSHWYYYILILPLIVLNLNDQSLMYL